MSIRDNFIFSKIPPTNNPIGKTTIPHKIPLHNISIFFSFTIPHAKGKVKLIVHPNIDDINIPEKYIIP